MIFKRLLLASIGLSGAYSYLRLDGMDSYGMDMLVSAGNQTIGVPGLVPIDCVGVCQRMPECRLVTWYQNQCYPKWKVSNITQLDGARTFLMYPEDIDAWYSNSSEGDITFPPEQKNTETPTPEPVDLETKTPEPSIEPQDKLPDSSAAATLVASVAGCMLALALV